MRVVVTGACGLLGSHLAAGIAQKHQVFGIDRHSWWGDRPVEILDGDLRNEDFCGAALAATSPDVLIHCAAMVNVDACERDPSEAYRVNAGVTRTLARRLRPECILIYIATDSVFTGDRAFASESDLPCPRTAYARSKLQGEWEVQLAARHHLIVRTNFYGWSSGAKPTFGEWLYAALDRGESTTLFDDVYFTPIYVVDLVESIAALVRGGHRGIFHVCGRERVSKYGFAAELARQAGFSIETACRGSVDDAPLAAPRSKDMSLDSHSFERAVGRELPGVTDGISRFLADRGRSLSERVAARW